ncbi:MAG TPA: ATP-binding protein [Gammaproteobacteria bacterium]|nr:ATP-binding protein [Gammaproteobacteria bacterium]
MDKEVAQNDWLASLARPGNGEMGERIAALDWSKTPIGPVDSWPQSLKATVKMLLATQYPMLLTWGPDFTQFYNDGYSKFIGDKHPAALGGDCRVTLGESWDVLGPMIDKVMATGIANWTPALLLLLYRAGYAEESYFSVSHSAVQNDSGRIAGMLAVCSEVTQQVIGERRLTLLRRLAAAAGETKSVAAVCEEMATEIGQHPLDVPFALIYLRQPNGRTLALSAAVGLAEGGPASPPTINLDSQDDIWPFTRAAGGVSVHVEEIGLDLGATGGPWNSPVESALVMPIAGSAQAPPLGVLIAGISPNRALDEDYQSFYELLAGQVSTALRNAQAYEEERRRAEALAELDRAKTAFFSNVSHEFRTPLTLMLGPTEDALGSRDKALRGENLETVYRNELRLLKLVNTLLDFSRIESGRIQASYRPADLAALTADLASNFRSAIERADIAFVVETESVSEPVFVDRGMWENIVLNLLSNAFKFTFSGEIAVALRERADSVELVVRDTGAGIAADQLPHIFERFHRVQEVRSRTHEGSGIGLALVQELVKLHGGEISVESGSGRGTTFTVAIPKGQAHLPANQIDAAEAAEASSARAGAYVSEALRWLPDEESDPAIDASQEATAETGARVLVVDDNADMRQYVARLLSERHAVEAVHDGTAALDAACRDTPDLVLSDVMMPGLNGFELLDALRQNENTRRVPVILLSARAGEEARIEGLQAGADDYLIKPFSARELVARVDNQLRMARLRRDYEAERQAVHARDQFLSIASHELNTPLAALRLQIALCKRLARNDVSDQLNETLRASDRQVMRLAGLVSKLLDVSRARLGRLDLKLGSCNLAEAVRRVVEQHRGELYGAGVPVTIAAPERTVVGLFDQERIEQVIANLVMNAVKHAPGAPLSIRIEEQAGNARLIVRDEGPGVVDAQRPHLFGIFGYGEANRDLGGLGLGLYISQQIIEAHGGNIRLQQDAGAAGACFVVELPLNP